MVNTFGQSDIEDKIYLHSGRLEATLKDSTQNLSSTDGTPRGVVNRPPNMLWSGDSGNKWYLSNFMEETLLDSQGWGDIDAASHDCSFDGDDYFTVGDISNKLFHASGTNSTTLKDSVAAVGSAPRGIEATDTAVSGAFNTLHNDANTRKIYLNSGQILATIKDSFNTGDVGLVAVARAGDGSGVLTTYSLGDKIIYWSGEVTNTIKDSIAQATTNASGCGDTDFDYDTASGGDIYAGALL